MQVDTLINGTAVWLSLDSWTAQALVDAESTYTHDFDLDDYSYGSRYKGRPVRVEVSTNSRVSTLSLFEFLKFIL